MFFGVDLFRKQIANTADILLHHKKGRLKPLLKVSDGHLLCAVCEAVPACAGMMFLKAGWCFQTAFC